MALTRLNTRYSTAWQYLIVDCPQVKRGLFISMALPTNIVRHSSCLNRIQSMDDLISHRSGQQAFNCRKPMNSYFPSLVSQR